MAELSGGPVAYVDQGEPDAPPPCSSTAFSSTPTSGATSSGTWPTYGAASRPTCRPTARRRSRQRARPADLTLNGHAARLDELCAHLGLDQVDVVANDTGGAVAQVFAARYPGRIRTLTLTNCDVHDNFPPELFKPFVAMAEAGELGPWWPPWRATTRWPRSEAGFGMGYATAAELSDELLTSYIAPFAADGGKGLERFLVAPKAEELIAVAPLLAELQAPVQLAWGTADSSSSRRGPSACAS